MSDLISRQLAIDAVRGRFSMPVDNLIAEVIGNLPSARAEPKWIPCSERLPNKHGESYIVTISDSSVYSATLQWDANCKRWYLSFLNDDGNILVDFIEDVIAWMPLPKPWRGEANDEQISKGLLG